MIQLSALGISLGVAVVAGVITGFIINIEFFCSGMKDTELFEDFFFFQTPYELEEETAALTLRLPQMQARLGVVGPAAPAPQPQAGSGSCSSRTGCTERR